jgi:hypothetical protein
MLHGGVPVVASSMQHQPLPALPQILLSDQAKPGQAWHAAEFLLLCLLRSYDSHSVAGCLQCCHRLLCSWQQRSLYLLQQALDYSLSPLTSHVNRSFTRPGQGQLGYQECTCHILAAAAVVHCRKACINVVVPAPKATGVRDETFVLAVDIWHAACCYSNEGNSSWCIILNSVAKTFWA